MTLWGKAAQQTEDQTKEEIKEIMKEVETTKEKSMPPITTASQPVRTQSTFDDICREIMETHRTKNDQYASSPVDELSVSAWKYQIQIKATRALRANTPEKLKDELLDTAVYCILLLEKMRKEGM